MSLEARFVLLLKSRAISPKEQSSFIHWRMVRKRSFELDFGYYFWWGIGIRDKSWQARYQLPPISISRFEVCLFENPLSKTLTKSPRKPEYQRF